MGAVKVCTFVFAAGADVTTSSKGTGKILFFFCWMFLLQERKMCISSSSWNLYCRLSNRNQTS